MLGNVWDDVDDIEQLISMPDSATHAVTDKVTRLPLLLSPSHRPSRAVRGAIVG